MIELRKDDFRALAQYGSQPVYFFRYDTVETENETIQCEETTIFAPHPTYGKMVSACIAVKYDTDAQLALLYNYQSAPEEYAEEMAVYQTWREYCKQACEIFKEATP